jgi:TetR/AcrR family transcriptional regulator, transcriptional repressor for nem operon
VSRYAPGHKQEARARILAAVGRGFRKRGYGGIGVDGLAKEAEVTSGALYGHFPSKEAAFKEAVMAGIDELRQAIEALRAEHGAKWVEIFIDFYLGQKRVCDLGESCALQSLTPEVQRADDETRATFEAHIELVAQAVADGLAGTDPRDRLARAWALLAILSGGVTLARAVADRQASEAIADAIRQAASKAAGKGEKSSANRPR